MQHPFIFSDERRYRLRRHLAFWIFWWLFFTILYSYTGKVTVLPNFQRIPLAMLDSIMFMTAHIFLAYSLMYYVIPRFIFKGKYLAAALLVLLSFLVTASISALIGTYILPPIRYYLFSVTYIESFNSTYLLSLLAGLRGAITIGGLAAAIKLMKYWYIKEQGNLQLQKENAEAGLQLLKAQLHPHFLFNTLNNIYSFTQHTAPVASEMLTGLSGMLRYILYEANQPLVPLGKELQMIQDYINLENKRYGNRLELHVDMPEQTSGLFIAPLLLLPLVENCFKHGTSNMLEQPWINLKISTAGKQLQMKLLNGKADLQQSKTLQEGIGLKNIQKRLSLLYPGKHELTITSGEEVFIVNL
ncbi:MAG: histidine kinase, partial [Bacteroidota bacterium]